jgi:serine/threonine-protein kinase
MLMRIPHEGGEGIPIAASGNVGADWGPDNNIVIGSEKSGLRLVSAEGGSTKVFTSLREGEIGHWFPKFIPGGHAVVFFAFTGDRTTGQVGLYDFSSGKRRTLLRGTKPMYSASGHLLFWRDGSLWAVRFDPVRLAMSGDPVVVIQGLGADPNGDAWYSLSREGTLVYIMEDSWRAIGETKPELIVSNNWFETVTRVLPSP